MVSSKNTTCNSSKSTILKVTLYYVFLYFKVDDKKVVSGSYDKTLKVWDIKTGNCQLTLR